jgi:hypothetical protein
MDVENNVVQPSAFQWQYEPPAESNLVWSSAFQWYYDPPTESNSNFMWSDTPIPERQTSPPARLLFQEQQRQQEEMEECQPMMAFDSLKPMIESSALWNYGRLADRNKCSLFFGNINDEDEERKRLAREANLSETIEVETGNRLPSDEAALWQQLQAMLFSHAPIAEEPHSCKCEGNVATVQWRRIGVHQATLVATIQEGSCVVFRTCRGRIEEQEFCLVDDFLACLTQEFNT